MPVHRPRRHHIGPIDGSPLIFVNRRRIAVVDRLIVAHRHADAIAAPAVELRDDHGAGTRSAGLDTLNGA